MEERIHQHKENRGMEWITWEQPYSLDLVANVFTQEDLILIDCLTILTANELFKGGTVQNVSRVHNKIINDIKLLEQKVKFLVIVSNDLFSGGVPTDSGTFLYMKLLGALHQDIAKLSSTVYQVSYGIPKLMKG
jgi:adenosylcobinamide kinase/adenosylcobinamide-phosphate guanylyltransferase